MLGKIYLVFKIFLLTKDSILELKGRLKLLETGSIESLVKNGLHEKTARDKEVENAHNYVGVLNGTSSFPVAEVSVRPCLFYRFKFSVLSFYSKKLSENVTSTFYVTVKNSKKMSHLSSN